MYNRDEQEHIFSSFFFFFSDQRNKLKMLGSPSLVVVSYFATHCANEREENDSVSQSPI